MSEVRTNTREHLLEKGGELFAGLGYEGVSTRMIADAAGVKVSAIHYHYGSKEKLYLAALQFAVEYDSCADFSSVIAENPVLMETPEGRGEIIRTTVFRSFYDHFKEEVPFWTTQLVVRELMKPSALFPVFADTVVKPDLEAAEQLCRLSKPGVNQAEITAWIDILHSQIFLYVMAKDALEVIRGEHSMNSSFYQSVARVVARAMILELELPLPHDLQ